MLALPRLGGRRVKPIAVPSAVVFKVPTAVARPLLRCVAATNDTETTSDLNELVLTGAFAPAIGEPYEAANPRTSREDSAQPAVA